MRTAYNRPLSTLDDDVSKKLFDDKDKKGKIRFNNNASSTSPGRPPRIPRIFNFICFCIHLPGYFFKQLNNSNAQNCLATLVCDTKLTAPTLELDQ